MMPFLSVSKVERNGMVLQLWEFNLLLIHIPAANQHRGCFMAQLSHRHRYCYRYTFLGRQRKIIGSSATASLA
jgi:hypothetical protein